MRERAREGEPAGQAAAPEALGPRDRAVPSTLELRLRDMGEVTGIREALARVGVGEAWIVGGLLRDWAAGQTPDPWDVDVALPGSAESAAQEVARSLGGTAFPLDEAQGAWRVVLGRGRRVDLVPLRAGTIEADLAGRDFTVNAMAFSLLGCRGFLDPLGGMEHLRAGLLVPCSPRALEDDPVRVLRAYRFALGFGLERAEGLPELLAASARRLSEAAPERVRTELFATLGLAGGARGLRAMAEDGVLEALFPFVSCWRGFDQGDYHSYDLLEHSLRTAEAAEDLVMVAAGLPRPSELAQHLAQELEAGLTRLALLKAAAFFHDVAKPDTVSVEGSRRRFLSHDVQGGHRVRKVLAALRVGRRARAAAQKSVAAHLRLFGLAHQRPPTRNARLRYLRDLGNEVPEAVILALADEIATGPHPPALDSVTAAAREILELFWEKRGEVPPLILGRDLRSALGIPEGPVIGEILRAIAEAETRGEVGTRGDALALAKTLWEGVREPPCS